MAPWRASLLNYYLGLHVLLAEFHWRAAFLLLEQPVEVRHIIKSAGIADFRTRHRRIHQIPDSMTQTHIYYIIRKRLRSMRLEKAAEYAKQNGFDYFCTTLSISPLKNSQKINEIGFEIAKEYDIKWLPSDFKKKEGYKRSIELSREYDLYRQNFCGCVYSRNAKEENN